MPHPLQAIANEHNANHHDGCRNVDGEEVGFGLKAACVLAGVQSSCQVVEPVAGKFSQDCSDYRREVEKSYQVRVSVWRYERRRWAGLCFRPKWVTYQDLYR